ncbi:hypothetical protein BDZ94DRAFT_102802 [Collybia nuda]|uniref:NADAR domain-containing protein n=1 Tax=Collybia nuda TaxID=64659 RepID=A0A9P5XXF4_9AGAR|nr:hypothetical protein BDZ94DRAFT_102802 [Collybia nuda]
MGISSSKHKFQQPYPPSKIPTYGRGPGFMPNPQGFIPGQMYGQGYGYMPQPGQFPPGFVPIGYGPLPQPMLAWPPQDKPRKRKSRKHKERDDFAGGFRPPTRAPTQASHPPRPGFIPPNGGPVFPEPQIARSTTTTRRAQTPFMRPSMDHGDDDDIPRTHGRATPHPQPNNGVRIQGSTAGRSRRDHTQNLGHPPSRPPYDRHRRDSDDGSVDDVSNGHIPDRFAPPQDIFGPGHGGSRAHLSNPLPRPPRDIYETTPYRALLDLQHTTELLNNYAQPEPTLQSHVHSPPKETKKPKKGLFRAFSSRKSEENKEKEPKVLYVPVVMPGNNTTAGSSAGRLPAMPPLGGPNPPDIARSFSVSNPPIPRPPSPVGSQERDPPIRFNQDTVHAGFLNHSPYRVIYDNKIYPTATHLLEALKFMPHRMDIVEQIRACADVAGVYPLSATLQQHARKDWAQIHLEQMLEVLYLKFTQHANLRSQLLETFDAELIYSDPTDSFWGEGQGGGANTYGRLLEQVRARLQEGRPTKRPRDT